MHTENKSWREIVLTCRICHVLVTGLQNTGCELTGLRNQKWLRIALYFFYQGVFSEGGLGGALGHGPSSKSLEAVPPKIMPERVLQAQIERKFARTWFSALLFHLFHYCSTLVFSFWNFAIRPRPRLSLRTSLVVANSRVAPITEFIKTPPLLECVITHVMWFSATGCQWYKWPVQQCRSRLVSWMLTGCETDWWVGVMKTPIHSSAWSGAARDRDFRFALM